MQWIRQKLFLGVRDYHLASVGHLQGFLIAPKVSLRRKWGGFKAVVFHPGCPKDSLDGGYNPVQEESHPTIEDAISAGKQRVEQELKRVDEILSDIPGWLPEDIEDAHEYYVLVNLYESLSKQTAFEA